MTEVSRLESLAGSTGLSHCPQKSIYHRRKDTTEIALILSLSTEGFQPASVWFPAEPQIKSGPEHGASSLLLLRRFLAGGSLRRRLFCSFYRSYCQ